MNQQEAIEAARQIHGATWVAQAASGVWHAFEFEPEEDWEDWTGGGDIWFLGRERKLIVPKIKIDSEQIPEPPK